MTSSREARNILVVEDERALRIVMRDAITGFGYEVDEATGVEEAKKLLGGKSYLAAFLDIRLPDGNGLDLLTWIRQRKSPVSCVVMTAEATMGNAIQAVKKGAFEYLVKPFDLDEVEGVLGRIRQLRMMSSGESPAHMPQRDAHEFEIVGSSPAMQKLYKQIGKAAPSGFTVLITGESGSGKELVARNLHEFSERASGPFVAVNCSAIPKDLMESEFFGFTRGAFTGADRNQKGLVEEANGGTLFMDEIGELGMKMQVKLLRLLEEGKVTPLGSRKSAAVDVRFVAATNRDLHEMVEKGDFREDLYHRLNVIPLHIPPLRKRQGDVELLARYFVKRYGNGKKISDEACDELAKRTWPGNVRQLQNTIKRTLVMAGEEETLMPEHFTALEKESPEELGAWIHRHIAEGGENIHERVMGYIEAELIRQALEKCGGNRIKAARLLGINRNTITKKVKDYSLD